MKWLLWLGYIFSFGLLYLWIVKKSKQIAQQPNTKLVESTSIPFKVKDFVSACGGKENFVNIKTTPTQLIVTFKDVNSVSLTKLNALNIKGINKNQNQFRFVLGNFVNELKKKIEDEQ
ncbi:PTS sugar transporter subunit IIB [Mycoplasmoides genitalium]|uniref:Putative phosphotransferase enzyme IIB component MG129 n=2 Tax=Mycoplasmoides genitalium TaxID=2097 RepID=Y129_MYCGE|nr:PTS sugar transporter subunit IIB [Mycoplasmoides genitalium]Q49397.1 RecName: Full=Putative phosphotransferase enzyme IIB component MG129; AltName: Full=Putative PTS system EIIB component [Mycoplasmoides genitalium G37]ABY79543.1 conserved hypothetical protein [synthetic Mycoplasma genitalium JCVI-1.0]AAC71347.1 conserved hypothetical protein [Mycoplasmoides genitalium G37]AFQ02946.1 hypothetical protein CM9_00705 [Mycoplasmoides genitalium M2321]AFQ03936.1 hypothetical protein CM1_00730 [